MCAVLLPIGGRRPPLQHETKKLDAFGITDRSYTIVPLTLDFAAEKGGMAVSAVWRLVYFLAPCPSEPKEQTAAHRRCLWLVVPTDRRDALCSSTQIQKQAAFGMRPDRSGCTLPRKVAYFIYDLDY